MSDVRLIYVCATPDCSEWLRGACDEPSFCSVCLQDLTCVALGDGVEVEDVLAGSSAYDDSRGAA